MIFKLSVIALDFVELILVMYIYSRIIYIKPNINNLEEKHRRIKLRILLISIIVITMCIVIYCDNITNYNLYYYVLPNTFLTFMLILLLVIFKSKNIYRNTLLILIVQSMFMAISLFGLVTVSLVFNISVNSIIEQITIENVVAQIVAIVIQVIFTIIYMNSLKYNFEVSNKVLGCLTLIPMNFTGMSLIAIKIWNVNFNYMHILMVLFMVIQASLAILMMLFYKEIFLLYKFINKFYNNEDKESYKNEVINIYEDMKMLNHDFKNHASVILGLVELGEQDKLISYIKEISQVNYEIDRIIYTENVVLNTILNIKNKLAQNLNINMMITVEYSHINEISDGDICALVGNLLDNSIEACETVGGDKYVEIYIGQIKQKFIIKVVNSNEGEINRNGLNFISTKKKKYKSQERGLGTKQINNIVEKYDGYIKRSYNEEYFESVILIPIKNK